MKDNNEEVFTSYVEFENEDGDTITLEVIDYFDYEGDLYGILVNGEECDEENEEAELEVCVLKVEKTEEGEQFIEPDEEKIPALQAIVEKILTEECDDDCCCDDDCDCHHHH